MTPHFNQFLKFTELIYKFRTVERTIPIIGGDRKENDTEHSYTLAMFAWYIVSTYKLDLDIAKVLQYAIAHDLVEVYAGDTFFYETDTTVTDSKQQREADAAEQIKKEFPEFGDLHQIIHDYEKGEDLESKFIYALDKLEPIFTTYLDKGRSWRKENLTFEMIKTMKGAKIARDKTIESIFNSLIDKIHSEHDELFTDK